MLLMNDLKHSYFLKSYIDHFLNLFYRVAIQVANITVSLPGPKSENQYDGKNILSITRPREF